jgi:hypothetical protein
LTLLNLSIASRLFGAISNVADELYQLGADLLCEELITLAVRMDIVVLQHSVGEAGTS